MRLFIFLLIITTPLVTTAKEKPKAEEVSQKDISKHVEQIRKIAAINSGKTLEEKAQRCLKLLDYYESLVTKTYSQKLELSARTGFFQFTGADTMTNFPMVKMKTNDIEMEYALMSSCSLVFNNIGKVVGDNFPIIMSQVARVAYIKQKIEPSLYEAQGYVVRLNPLSRIKNVPIEVGPVPVTTLDLSDEQFLLKTKGELSGTGTYHFFSIISGKQKVKLRNGFDKTLPILTEVSPKSIDALFMRALILEGTMPYFTKEKHRCGLQRSKSDVEMIQLSILCDRAKNFQTDEDGVVTHKEYGFRLYPIEDK